MAKRCNAPSCYVIVRDGTGRCETHTITKRTESNELRYTGANKNKKLYDSKRWRRISKRMRAIMPFCQHCWDEGTETVADVVDHIVELSDGGAAFELSNLEPLCNQCHNTKTANAKRERDRKSNKRDRLGEGNGWVNI